MPGPVDRLPAPTGMSDPTRDNRYDPLAYNEQILYPGGARPQHPGSSGMTRNGASMTMASNQWGQAFPPQAGAMRRRLESDDMYAQQPYGTGAFEPVYDPPAKKARTEAPPSRVSSESVVADGVKRNGSAKSKGRGKSKGQDEADEGDGKAEEYPSVLTREKKQKACANCRKAKLRCIMDDGETDCVRCKSRKEKCVFYPRSQDEEWQATVSNDLYGAISHLAELSSAVHHVIHHLTDRGLIPPLPQPLQQYTPPEREGVAPTGWTAEHNRQLPTSERKRDTKRDATGAQDNGIGEGSAANPMSQEMESLNPMPAPETVWPVDPQQGQTRYWNPSLPAQADGLAMGSTMPPPTGPIATSSPDMQGSSRPLISPPISLRGDSIQGANTNLPTPELANILASPRMNTQTSGAAPSVPSAQYNTAIFMEHDMPGVAEGGPLASLNIVPGSDDSRQDVITKGVVDARDAVVLLNYSHQNLGKMMYGYQLEFGRFPYLAAGPTTITPLILAVLCLLGSERLAHLSYYRGALYGAVKTLLLESPAESWQRLGTAVNKNPDGINGEDELDPELGIGPEEIVGAAMLSMWIGGRNDAMWIADVAFKWARGWIRLLSGPPRNSIAEIAGIVPAERIASQVDMARVYLLCYLAEGAQAIMQPETIARGRETEDFCRLVLQQGGLANDSVADAHDIVLTENARTMYVYRQYLYERTLLAQQPASDARHRDLQRLVSRTDSKLQSMRDALDIVHIVPDHWVARKQLVRFGLYARAMVHHLAIRMGMPARQRGASMGICMDVSMELLEKYSQWRPREELSNSTQPTLNAIGMISQIVHDAICDTSQAAGSAGSFVTAAEAWPVFANLGDMLHLGSLPANHISRQIGDQLQQRASSLRRIAERSI